MKRTAPLRCVALLLAAQAAHSETAPIYVELPAGPAQMLVLEKDGTSTARMPIALPAHPTPLSQLEVRVFDVQFRESRSEAVVKDVQASLEAADSVHGDALLLRTLDGGVHLRPGTYTVTVRIAPAGGGLEKVQSITLVLQKPAPTLDVGPDVLVKHTNNLLGLAFAQSEPGQLQLREVSGNAEIADVRFRALPAQAGAATRATVMLPASATAIRPGESISFDIPPTEDAPLGSTKGRIEITTPDLGNVSSLAYEVSTREHPFLMVVLVATGAFFGWLLRVRIVRTKNYRAARIQASKASEAIDALKRTVADAGFGLRADAIKDKLQADCLSGNPEEMLSASAKAAEQLKELQSEFDLGRKREFDALAAMHDTLDKQWVLPPAIQGKLLEAHLLLNTALDSLQRNDVTAARAQRESLMKSQLLALLNDSAQWRRALAAYVEQLQQCPPPVADAELENLTSVSQKLADQLQLAPAVAASVEAVDDELGAAHAAWFVATESVKGLVSATEDFLVWGLTTLIPPATAGEDVDRLRQLTREFDAETASDLANPRERFNAPRERSRRFREAWRKLLEKMQVPQIAKLESLMSARKWSEAIDGALRVLGANRFGTSLGDASGLAVRTDKAPPGVTRIVAAASAPGGARALIAPILGTVAERQMLEQAIARAGTAQTIGVAIAFAICVYLLHMDSWVGTPKEIVGLLILAFATDLTSDGFLKALKT